MGAFFPSRHPGVKGGDKTQGGVNKRGGRKEESRTREMREKVRYSEGGRGI